MKKFAIAAIAGATLLTSVPAGAQYWDPYERPAPRWERPAPRWGYDNGYYSRGEFNNVCVTSRGDCRVRPGPVGAGCRCFIPGFGPKRGNIGY